MRLVKLPYEPSALADFFQEGLETLGAVCERTWHNRLHVMAEGAAAKLWNADCSLIEKEVHFPPPDDPAPRQADHEVFPGCPLMFHLAEALIPPAMALQHVVVEPPESLHAPPENVAAKLWSLQFPGATGWRMESNFCRDWHFSLLVLLRCEIQAIDQHWSLHRLALSLPDGSVDDLLAQNLGLLAVTEEPSVPVPWPRPDPAAWEVSLRDALRRELDADLVAIRQRQENYLRRELDRIDDYFQNYEKELSERLNRQAKAASRTRLEERLTAARAEHERRRLDQVQRHEIRLIPHPDALLLVAEPSWRITLTLGHRDAPRRQEACFIPRARRWVLDDSPTGNSAPETKP